MEVLKDLILVKLGGSVITEKDKISTENLPAIKRLANEIFEARKEKDFNLIIGNGAGSFAHVPAKEYEIHKGEIRPDTWYGFAKTQDAASRLNRIIVKELIEAGNQAVSVQASTSCISNQNIIDYWYLEPVEKFLEKDIIPVPYGDPCIDREMGCCIISTDEIMRYLAENLTTKRVIMVSNVNGVLRDKNNPDSVIPEITRENFEEIKEDITDPEGIDVTGGMIFKIDKLLQLADNGVESVIINGLVEGNLKKALLDKNIGTIIR